MPSIPPDPTSPPGPSRWYAPGRWALVVALCASAPGCHHVNDDEVRGELGAGKFRYECVTSNDPVCPSGSDAEDFPDRIGAGGVFDVEFKKFRGHTDPSDFSIDPVAPAIVARDLSSLRAVAPGTVALLARDIGNNRIVDLVHVVVTRVEALRIERLGASISTSEGDVIRQSLAVGDREVLRAIPLDSDGIVAAGSRDFDWSSSDETIVELSQSSPSATMTLEARDAGTATIVVATADIEARLEILVESGPATADAGRDASPLMDATTDGSPTADGGASMDSGTGRDAGRQGLPDASPAEAGAGPRPDATPDGSSADGGSPDAGDGAP